MVTPILDQKLLNMLETSLVTHMNGMITDNSLTNGIDCSHFTSQIFGHFGIPVTGAAASQATQGTAVDVIANAQKR